MSFQVVVSAAADTGEGVTSGVTMRHVPAHPVEDLSDVARRAYVDGDLEGAVAAWETSPVWSNASSALRCLPESV